jgi:phosphotransferase system enzyme I (PtsI)
MSSDKQEIFYRGSAAAPGVTIGRVYVYKKEVPRITQWSIDPLAVPAEIERFDRSVARSEKELGKILAFAQQKIGETKAKIFEAQIMVLQDAVLLDAIRNRITAEKKNADYIVNDEIGKFADMMLAADSEYMHERAHDMDDLKFRIIRNMQQEKLLSRLEGEMIIVSHSLTPADTMILSRNNVLGYATDLGGITSHAALLSASMKIPAVVGLGDFSRHIATGDLMILDGFSGTAILHPTPDRILEYEQKRDHFLQFETDLQALKDLPAVTTDGKQMELSANIEFQEEIEYVVVQGSQGIGLYRTESMLYDREDFPTEQEQLDVYREVVERIYPNRVIMRTFDVGGDKIAPEMAEEENPFLGWRGIRMMLDRPDLFKNQLSAMLRASKGKNLSIMFPMITHVGEVKKAKAILEEVKADLKSKKQKFDLKVKIGAMIEVPAAAMRADEIAREVDFLSVGSNDLTMYLLAVDRNNSLVSGLYRELEPSVIRTLKNIVECAHREKKWAGICGDMASHPVAVPLLVGLGFDELSVIPSLLPEIKKIIRTLSHAQVEKLAAEALALDSAEAVQSLLEKFMKEFCPEIPI